MANTFDKGARLYTLGTDDILTFKQYDDANSGLNSITVAKIQLIPNAAGDGVTFYSLINRSADVELDNDTFTVSGTNRISDDAGAALDATTIAIGDLVHIWHSASGNNEGWYYISAIDSGANTYIEVQNTTNALTDEANIEYSLKTYSPSLVMNLKSEAGSNANMTELDWLPRGRRFHNLIMTGFTSGSTVYLYVL